MDEPQTLAGSRVLWGGREWTVLSIRPEGCLMQREGAELTRISLPAAWRAYEAQTRAMLDRRAAATRLDPRPYRL
jgi:hypothetical protein